jgi:hypothetical protein
MVERGEHFARADLPGLAGPSPFRRFTTSLFWSGRVARFDRALSFRGHSGTLAQASIRSGRSVCSPS